MDERDNNSGGQPYTPMHEKLPENMPQPPAENVDIPIAKRIVDFISGAVYANEGHIQKIADKIFLITPYSVGIIGGDIKDELKKNIILPY